MKSRVTITNGQRDNVKTTTPLKDRHIKKLLEGKMAPSREDVIEKFKKEKNYEARKETYPPSEAVDRKVASES